MKKLAILAATGLVLVLAAVAYAQVTNTYTVEASTSPARPGTKSDPVPVGIKFNFQVGEVQNRRPSPIQKYSIRFRGLRVNTNSFPGCTAAQLRARGKAGCRSALVGSGKVKNASGATNNPADKSITCNLVLSVYNSRNNKGLLLLEGGPGQGGDKECPIEFGTSNGVIPTNYVRKGGGAALEFAVPGVLRHPLATLDNSVVDTQSSIKRLVRNGKGYYEAEGGCTNGRRTVQVVFTPESGPAATASTPARC
jgi:hypothetical protein